MFICVTKLVQIQFIPYYPLLSCNNHFQTGTTGICLPFHFMVLSSSWVMIHMFLFYCITKIAFFMQYSISTANFLLRSLEKVIKKKEEQLNHSSLHQLSDFQ